MYSHCVLKCGTEMDLSVLYRSRLETQLLKTKSSVGSGKGGRGEGRGEGGYSSAALGEVWDFCNL